jgi:hypothetical protein
VIIGGAHFCSSHGLDVTMERLADRRKIVVDLRSEVMNVDLGEQPVELPLRALAG